MTFVHVACSGATVASGLLGPQEVGAQDDRGTAQVAQVGTLVGGRTIDALVVSIGGNDIHFANIIKSCMLGHCGTGYGDRAFGQRMALLSEKQWPALYACLVRRGSCAEGVLGLYVSPESVFVAEYPDPTTIVKDGSVQDCSYGSPLSGSPGPSSAGLEAPCLPGWIAVSGAFGVLASMPTWFRSISQAGR